MCIHDKAALLLLYNCDCTNIQLTYISGIVGVHSKFILLYGATKQHTLYELIIENEFIKDGVYTIVAVLCRRYYLFVEKIDSHLCLAPSIRGYPIIAIATNRKPLTASATL